MIAVLLGVALLALHLQPAAAQAGVALGIASPRADAADRRQAGPMVFASSQSELSRFLSVRFSGEAAFLPGRPIEDSADRYPSVLTLGGSLAVVLHGSGDTRPYVLAGGGLHGLALIDDPHERGPEAALSLNAGLGFERPVFDGWKLFGEVRWMLYLTDYAAGDFVPFTYRDLKFGVGIPLTSYGRR